MTPFTLSRAEVRELDRRAIEGFGVPGIVLMENAGRGCAELLMRLNPERKPTVIVCGPGNNGGDGFVIARHLDNHGWPVNIHVFAKHNRGEPGDSDINFDILYTSGIQFTQYRPDCFDKQHRDHFLKQCSHPDGWVVDALFGTGLSRPLGEPFDWIVGIVNGWRLPVLAVDIPSGLDCDTGEPLGPTLRATHTATFVGLKRGFLNPASSDWTGEVHVIDIGAPRVLVEEYRNR
ncbi:MAG: NAD(P)H-hydrate epimerase [Gemmataceae bacterium]